MIKRIGTICILGFLVLQAQAYFPPKGSGYSSKPYTSVLANYRYENASDSLKAERMRRANNTLKIGTVYWGNGIYPIYYERRIGSLLTIQAGLGVTTRDFIADLVNVIANQGGSRSDVFTGFNDEEDYYWDYTSRKAVAGIYASLQPRFYLVEKAPTGFFIGPIIEFKRNNYKIERVDANGSTIKKDWMKEYRNALDLGVHFGGQWLVGNHCAIEFAFSLGARKFWEVRQDLGLDTNTGDYINAQRNYTNFRPQAMLHFNIGGFF